MNVTPRVLAGAGPTFTKKAGPLVVDVVDALTGPLADVDALTTPTPGGWPTLVDLDTTPDPAWLGHITGTRIPAGIPAETARAMVRDLPALRRGTPAAMLAAARAVMPTGLITLLERDGSAWKTTIRLYAAEATVDDAARVKAAASKHKPPGIILDVVRVSGATFDHMAAEHGPTFADERAEFPTFVDAVAHIPEEGTIP